MNKFPSTPEAITPILALYSTLRHQTNAAVRAADTLTQISVVAMGGVMTLAFVYEQYGVFVAAAPSFILLGSYWCSVSLNTWYASRYCGILEERVNRLLGEDALAWESNDSDSQSFSRILLKLRHVESAPGGELLIATTNKINPAPLLLYVAIIGMIAIELVNIAVGGVFVYDQVSGGRVLKFAAGSAFQITLLAWLVLTIYSYRAGRQVIEQAIASIRTSETILQPSDGIGD